MRVRGSDAWSGHNDSLDALARRAAEGDATAFEQLLEVIETEGLIRRPVHRVLIGSQMVEDVCQDVLVTLMEKIGTWDGRSTFSSWLYVVARNRAADRLKTMRPTEPLPDVIAERGRRMSSLISTREAIRQAVEALPEKYRIPLQMRDFQELDYPTIGRLLGLREAAVRARVKRGRRKVGERLREVRT